MTQKDALHVSNLACANATQTHTKMMFTLYGIRCFDTYNELKYIENILFIDLLKSGYECPQISKC